MPLGHPDVLRDRFAQRADPPLSPELEPYFERVLARTREPVLAHPALIEQFDATEFDRLEAAYQGLLERMGSEVAAAG